MRKGPHLVARARVRVAVGGQAGATLEAVVAPAEPTPPGPVNEPPPVTLRPKASAWPWVLGGTAAAGLVGAGAFYGLHAGERADLRRACPENTCPEAQRDAVGRADLYGTLSMASLGVGLVAGAGLVTYLVLARREPKVVGVAVPIAGGWALSAGGSF